MLQETVWKLRKGTKKKVAVNFNDYNNDILFFVSSTAYSRHW